MELNKVEQIVVEAAVANAEAQIKFELSELHLALVGGGIGDTIL